MLKISTVARLLKILCVWILCLTSLAEARLVLHAEHVPLVKKGVEYSLIAKVSQRVCLDDRSKPCETQELVMAREQKSGRVLWQTPLYKVIYNAHLDKDVQDVPIRTFVWAKAHVKVIDDRGTVYLVNAESGHLLRPSAPKTYDQAHDFDSDGYL